MISNRDQNDYELVGIGIDIFRVQRILDTIKKDKKILRRIFTENELLSAQKSERQAEQLASFFSGKEAVFKALRLSWADKIKWTDIEIVKKESGLPRVNLKNRARDIAINKGVGKILLSLSHETDYAVAVCVAIRFNQRA